MLLIVSLLAGALGLGACGGHSGRGASGDTLPPLVSTTSATAVSYAVPPVIDQVYVAKVMAALDHVYGDAVRHLAQTRQVDDQFLKYLVAIHNPRIFQLAEDLWVKIQARNFAGLATTPGDPTTRIDKLLRADKDCILIQGDQSLTPFFDSDTPPDHHHFLALAALQPTRNPDRLNPTPWTINFSGQAPDGSLPEDACAVQ